MSPIYLENPLQSHSMPTERAHIIFPAMDLLHLPSGYLVSLTAHCAFKLF